MKISSTPRGFTLIELLVVVAIIGILSAVVLGSLNTARTKGQNASVRSNLASARSQAQLYHSANGNSFEGLCDSGVVAGEVQSIYTAVIAAVTATGGTGVGTGPTTATNGTCNDTADQWAVEAQLLNDGYYCIDSAGTATTTPVSLLGTSELVCQ